jgi:hypothetical protein
MAEDTDQELFEIFNPLFPRRTFAEGARPPLLAHYTSIKAMEAVLKTNKVWFSNPLFMNDLQEVRFGITEGARLFEIELQKKVGRSEEQVTILRDLFAGHLQRFYIQDAFDTYVFCLSEHDRANTDDLLSMLRGYGQHGNGAAIVFDSGAVTLVPTSPLIISKVSYASDRDRTAQLEERLEQSCDLLSRARSVRLIEGVYGLR